MKKYNIAIIGATGNVGREILNILEFRKFPINKIFALASSRSEGTKIIYGDDKDIVVSDLEKFNFKDVDIVLSSAGSNISKKYSDIAIKEGSILIDNTSYFRMEKNVPLIVPEVNPEDLKTFSKKKIIANPNCSTIQMVMALKPIHDLFKVKKIFVSTYQSTSGAGKTAMDELFHQTKTKIDIFSTCVRVPVFVGHGESVFIETEKKINLKKVISAMKKFPGLSLVNESIDGGYVTPDESAGEDDVFVSRIRVKDEKKMGMWVVADNLRKGAALNTVQIAELLIKKYLKK